MEINKCRDLEDHGTRYLRPLATVQRMFGLFPVTFKNNKLSFSYYSPVTIASTTLPYVGLFLIIFTRKGISKQRMIQLTAYGVQLFLKGLPMIFTFRAVADLLDKLNTTDALLRNSVTMKHRLLWPCASLSFYILLFLFFMFVTGNWSVPMSIFTRILSSSFYQKEIQQVLLFWMLVYQINARFTVVIEILDDIERARLAFVSLVNCLSSLADAFSLRIFVIIVSMGYDHLVNIYMATYNEKAPRELPDYLFMVLDVITLYSFAYLSESISNKAKILKDGLLKISTTNKEKTYSQKVEIFLEVLMKSDLKITAWGVFAMDFSIFGTFFNTLLTFVIAMAGFSKEITAIIEQYGLDD